MFKEAIQVVSAVSPDPTVFAEVTGAEVAAVTASSTRIYQMDMAIPMAIPLTTNHHRALLPSLTPTMNGYQLKHLAPTSPDNIALTLDRILYHTVHRIADSPTGIMGARRIYLTYRLNWLMNMAICQRIRVQ